MFSCARMCVYARAIRKRRGVGIRYHNVPAGPPGQGVGSTIQKRTVIAEETLGRVRWPIRCERAKPCLHTLTTRICIACWPFSMRPVTPPRRPRRRRSFPFRSTFPSGTDPQASVSAGPIALTNVLDSAQQLISANESLERQLLDALERLQLVHDIARSVPELQLGGGHGRMHCCVGTPRHSQPGHC